MSEELEYDIEFIDENGDVSRYTSDQMEDMAYKLSRYTEIVVSGSRAISHGQKSYESENFFESIKIDFAWFWDRIPASAMLEPETGKKIAQAFHNGALRSIGVAMRNIYVNHLYSCASRARQLNLPCYPALIEELKGLKSKNTYDPFNVVVGKED